MRALPRLFLALILGVAFVAQPASGAGAGFTPLAVSASTQEVRSMPVAVSQVADISCATVTACVIASAPPERTLDGGATWHPFPGPAGAQLLTAVHCFSTGVCLAADNQIVARTVDFGVTWVVSSTPLFDVIRSFDCATPTSCVGVGVRGASQAAVATSADGGVTWTERTSSLGSQLGRVVCPNSTLCLALGADGLMTSANAGVTWTKSVTAATPYSIDSLACMAPSTCVYSAGATIQVTTDGSSWASMPLPFNQSPFDQIACASASLCVASSRFILNTQHFDPTTRTFALEPAVVGGGRTDAMDCVGLTCFEVETSFGFPAGNLTFANRSTDGANFWSSVQPLFGGGYLAGLDCNDATHCTAVGLDASSQTPFAIQSLVLQSADAGATWQPGTAPAELSRGLTALACAPATSVCVTAGIADPVTGRTGIDRSDDGGLTWQAASTDVPLGGFSDVHCRSATICMALGLDMSTPLTGYRSVVLRTIDGGVSWQSSMPVPQQAQFLVCQTASTCMLLRYQTSPGPVVLMRTVDSGVNWTVANTPVANVQAVRSLECNTTACSAVFDSGTAALEPVTTDAGLTWNTTPSEQTKPSFGPLPTCSPLLCVYVASFGDHSEVRSWSGTGAWDLVASSPATGFHHLVCPQPTVCVALATSGTTFGPALERIAINATPVGTVSGVQPARLLDTRVGADYQTIDHLYQGIGVRGAGSTLVLQVAGRGGVAPNATSAMLNLTIVQPSKPGFVTVYPCDQPRPVAANGNYVAGSIVASSVLAKLAADGTVCIFSQQSTHMVVDVGAFVPSDSTSIVGLPPARLLETRRGPGMVTVDGLYLGLGELPAGSTMQLLVGGRGGVPASAKAAVLNITATETKGPGFLTVYPCDQQRPVAANVNYVTGQTVPNAVYATLSGGTVCIYTLSATQIVVDVDAYAPGSGSYLQPLTPARVLDTRPGYSTIDGLFNGVGALAARTPFAVQVGGRGGVTADASTVMLNVAVTQPAGPGFVTVYPCDQPVPLAANVNFAAGATVANAAVAKMAPNGTVCFYSSVATHLVVDVNANIP